MQSQEKHLHPFIRLFPRKREAQRGNKFPLENDFFVDRPRKFCALDRVGVIVLSALV